MAKQIAKQTALLSGCVLAIGATAYLIIDVMSVRVHHSEVNIAKQIAASKGTYTVSPDNAYHITRVHLNDAPVIDDNLLQSLQSLKYLQWLDLDRTTITDQSMIEIAKLRTLEGLSIRETKVTNSGLRALVEMPHLYSIDPSGTSISSDAYMEVLESLPATGITKE